MPAERDLERIAAGALGEQLAVAQQQAPLGFGELVDAEERLDRFQVQGLRGHHREGHTGSAGEQAAGGGVGTRLTRVAVAQHRHEQFRVGDVEAFGVEAEDPAIVTDGLQSAHLASRKAEAVALGSAGWAAAGPAEQMAVAGTALDDAAFGNYLLVAGKPRSVDIKPIFHTGVPNLPPYQLATGKNGNPLAAGKPFVNNFLPLSAATPAATCCA